MNLLTRRRTEENLGLNRDRGPKMREEKDVTIRQILARRIRAYQRKGRAPRVLRRRNGARADPGVSQDYLLREARGGMTDRKAETEGGLSLGAERGDGPGLEAETGGGQDLGAGKEGGTTGEGMMRERGQEMIRIPRRERQLLLQERRKTFLPPKLEEPTFLQPSSG